MTTERALPTEAVSSDMRRGLAVLALTLLVVSPGCLTPFGTETTTPTPADISTVEAATDTPTAANPWGKQTLTVSVEQSNRSWRTVTDLVADTLEYWERNDTEYAAYEVDFELEPNATDPDVVVKYVEDISVCGSANRDGGAGFAPIISATSRPDPPESICVRHGYNEASTSHILRHEFGHLLGIGHGDPPTELMTPDYEYLLVPRPEPPIRSDSVQSDSVSVYVDRSDIYARRDYVAQQQLEHMVAYYERETEPPLGRQVSVTLVDDRESADVVFRFPQQSPCDRDRAGSCASVETRSEGRSQLEVTITTTHEDTYGWHAGFWLGIALGVDTHDELPAPFGNASFDDRHSAWWTED